MTNDNSPQKTIEERFEIALAELIGMCLAAGMLEIAMIGPLKKQLAALRAEAMPLKADIDAAIARGFPPVNEQEMRAALELEPYEPLPPERTR